MGDVPQEPAAFQLRPEVVAALDRPGGSRIAVVFAVTGIRGVGKTQVAAAYARRRIGDGWRLVSWVDATDEASVLTGLAHVAAAVGAGHTGQDARALATAVRHWLEADGEDRLLVFDNAVDLDGLRPFLPAGGAAQVVITSSRRPAGGLGVPVPVDVFTEDEALAFLAERTGLDDMAGARELAGELGFLPLALAQAAALIAREHLGYRTYLDRLRALPVADYMRRAEGDPYPHRLAEAIRLSLRAVEASDPSGMCAQLMGLISVLAETGAPRRLLHLAAGAGALGKGDLGAAEADAAVGTLADASLLGFTLDDSVVTHRLVMRVARERLAAEGGLPVVLANTVKSLASLADEIGEAWSDPAGVRELAGHINAIVTYLDGHPDAVTGEVLADLLKLRFRSVSLLLELSDTTGRAIFASKLLAADCVRVLGTDHPDSLMARNEFGVACQLSGRPGEAITLHKQTLSDYERVLGPDHPDTLSSRNNLAAAYRDAGRTAEAIPLHEQTVRGFERVLGPDHPGTLTSRTNLALAYQDAGRIAEAITDLKQTLSDRERVLRADHPHTLTSRDHLAAAYQVAGRTTEAITLHEQTLSDRERVLGPDHPNTLTSLNNLAVAYRNAGRLTEAITLHEQTLSDRERVLGPDHPNTLTSRNDLAMAYQSAGQTAEAITDLEQTLSDRERVLGPDHPDTLTSRTNLALAYQDAGRTAESVAMYQQALRGFERVLGQDRPATNLVRQKLAALTGQLRQLAR